MKKREGNSKTGRTQLEPIRNNDSAQRAVDSTNTSVKPQLRPLSGAKKVVNEDFDSTVARSRGVRDRIRAKFDQTFTKEKLEEEAEFARNVLQPIVSASNTVSAYKPPTSDAERITDADAFVSRKKVVAVFPIADTPLYPPRRAHSGWQVGLRQYDKEGVVIDSNGKIKISSGSGKEDAEEAAFEFPVASESRPSSETGKVRKARQQSLVELKAAQYAQVELDLPAEEVIDRYFGVSAQQAYQQTYRQLHRHADLLRGGREELDFVVKDELEAAIFSQTEAELLNLGVLTPRGQVSRSKLRRSGRKSRPSSSSSPGVNKDHSNASKDNKINAGTAEPLNNGTNLANKLDEDVEDEDWKNIEMSYRPASPRAVFLAGCLRQGVAPRAIAMLRKRVSPILDLAHMGIGNATALLLAEALDRMPYLQSLNLADNSLDDTGLSAIISAASRHPTLEVLDISQNVMDDEASEALAAYVGDAHCRLKCLRMSASDIDDGECARFVEVLMRNRHLKELDMSNNLIGKDENLNAVKPDFVTGGESLAELLRDSLCPLETLNLHWNMIRLEGAEVLCDALRSNAFLTNLDLSYNALGSHAACVLGAALLDNTALRTLNLANNAIDCIGAVTLAVGLRENATLHEVILDGNPIGEQGGRAVMKVVAQEAHRLRIRALNCDITAKNSYGVKLKLDAPVGDYLLHMRSAYDRAIAFELLEVVANDRNVDIAICDLYLSDLGVKDLQVPSRPSSPGTVGGSVMGQNAPASSPPPQLMKQSEKLQWATQMLGVPAASYQIVRFDQPRDTSSHTSWSSEEAQEAAFNETLAPLASLSAKHLHSVVKDYDTLGTDSFATSQLASLYDDLLLHRSLSPQQSPYKHARGQRDRLQDRLQKLQQQKTSVPFSSSDQQAAHETLPECRLEQEYEEDVDADGFPIDRSHDLTVQQQLEMDRLLQSLVEDTKKTLDPRDAGVIDSNAFVEYIIERARGARERLRQLRTIPRCAVRQRPTSPSSSRTAGNIRGSMVMERYVPPISGWLRIRVVESYNLSSASDDNNDGEGANSNRKSFQTKDIKGDLNSATDAINDRLDHDHLYRNTNSDPGQPRMCGHALSQAKCLLLLQEVAQMSKSHTVTLLLYAVDSLWLRLEEAQLLYAFARQRGDSDDPTAALAKILLRMQVGSEAMRMLACCVGDDVVKLRRLKQRLGNAYGPLVGLFSGYYALDLSSPLDRLCLKRLIEKSITSTQSRRDQGLWDTSQHGHWSCFRNEVHRQFGGQPGGGVSATATAAPNNNNSSNAMLAAGLNDVSVTSDDMFGLPFNNNNNNGGEKGGDKGSGSNKNADAGNVSGGPAGINGFASQLITPRWFCPIPTKGRVEFDFVHISRPDPILCRAVHEDAVLDALLLSRLLGEEDIPWAVKRLAQMAQTNRRSFVADGRLTCKTELSKALSIAEQLHQLYTSAHLRQASRKKAQKREVLKNVDTQQSSPSGKKRRAQGTNNNANSAGGQQQGGGQGGGGAGGGGGGPVRTSLYSSSASVRKKGGASTSSMSSPNKEPAPSDAPTSDDAPVTGNAVAEAVAAVLAAQQHTNSSHHSRGQKHAQEAILRFRSLARKGKRAEHKQQLWGARMLEVVVKGNGSDELKAAALLEFFEAELGGMWLQCRHLALVLEVYAPLGQAWHSHFGSYRVQLIVMLFDRLVDLHNFELVLYVLSAEEHACVLARIGTLNLFNPSKCEGGWAFDLLRWEERQVAKLLIHLSVVEPGENWLTKCFVFDRGFNPVPGWDLNRTWLSEDGLPKKGLLSFEMFAGNGLRLQGCCVDLKLRQTLSALSLVAQRNYVAEIERQEQLTEERDQEFHRHLDRRAVNVLHLDNLTHSDHHHQNHHHSRPSGQGQPGDQPHMRPVLPLIKLVTQLDLLRQLSHGTGTMEEMQQQLQGLQTRLRNQLHISLDLEQLEIPQAIDILDEKCHDILHYTVEDANEHLRLETDCSWNYTSTTRKPEVWH